MKMIVFIKTPHLLARKKIHYAIVYRYVVYHRFLEKYMI